MNKKTEPSIFWHSDPVLPNETLLICGEDFAPDACVDLVHGEKKASIKPVQQDSQTIKAVIPVDWEEGVWQCYVRQGKNRSGTVAVNAPHVWWFQGNEGEKKASRGGWLRIFGKCLKGAEVRLENIKLELTHDDTFDAAAAIPAEFEVGTHRLYIQDQECGAIEIVPERVENREVVNVLDFDADPTGMKDSTPAITAAMTRFYQNTNGGILYFPRGRYRIDSGVRIEGYVKAPLKIPAGVTLRGDGMDLTTLWWPDQKLSSLIEGGSDFGIEDVAIYTQGPHGTIIYGDSGARIRNVRIRANWFYMTGFNGNPHGKRECRDAPFHGAAIVLTGKNNQVTDCDIYTSALVFMICGGTGSLIAQNRTFGNNLVSLMDADKVIFEDNEFTGNQLSAGGNNIYMMNRAENVFYARNSIRHTYGGDHEAFSLDGHATAYLGQVSKDSELSWRMEGRRFAKENVKGAVKHLKNLSIFIMEGRGRGQYRTIVDAEEPQFTIDRAWTVEPDETSLVTIGGFNGRHIFLENTAEDTGPALQLYPPNIECIVARNRAIRTANYNVASHIHHTRDINFVRVEPSWFNQFLDNHVLVGNGWGGGGNEINFWLGGESTLSIHALMTFNDGNRQTFINAEQLQEILGEEILRTEALPLTCFQVVRRHRIDNNSSIRVRGAVSDAVVEHCLIQHSRRGIRINAEFDYPIPADLGQTFNFETHPPLPFQSPKNILVRANKFVNVEQEYSGTALDKAVILKD